MREILFRGKRTYNGEWVQGNLLTDGVGYGYAIKIIDKKDLHHGACFEVNSETVFEYSGLTDKNGKRIFEGDIVKWVGNGITFIDEVTFTCGQFKARDFPLFMVTLCNAEIIGNKWDNPELLEKGVE